MTKPIDYEELKWRIEAILRRAKIANDKRIVIGDFMLSSDSHTATYQDTQIELTTKEFELMYKLLSYPDVIFTKQQIMDEIWGYDTETTYDTIKTYISRLRNKFAVCNEFEIVSVRGLGYKVVLRGVSMMKNNKIKGFFAAPPYEMGICCKRSRCDWKYNDIWVNRMLCI